MASRTVKLVGIGTLLLLAIVAGFYISSNGSHAPYLNSELTPSPMWDIGELGKARMLFENTKRYRLDTEEGAREWESLVPQDGGIIYQQNSETGETEEYTISMFHQLRCLNVLRLELVRPGRQQSHLPNELLIKHCLNYLRQMILCRSDMNLETVMDPIGPHDVDITDVHTCKDWRKVYVEAANQQGRPSLEDMHS